MQIPATHQHRGQIGQSDAGTSTHPRSPCTVSALPPELLYEIFDHVCMPPESSAMLPRVGGRHLGPLWLGRICRRWRDIAWASPLLWTYIHLVPSSDKYDVQAQLLDDYLRRSEDLPLTIFFTMRTTNVDEYWNNRTLPLYELIAQECHRWEVIDIFIPYLCVPHMNATCLYLPLLCTASVEALKDGFPLHFIQNASLLRDLTLTIFALPDRLEKPFRHLTHFAASNLNSRDVLNVLKLAPNLRSCFIEQMQRPWPGALPEPVYVNLEHLESLTICHSSSMDAQDGLFYYITSAPALQEFRCSTRAEGYLPLGLIVEFMDRAQCQLETLELETRRLGRSDTDILLDRLLRRTMTLSSLVLHFDGTSTAEKFVMDIAKILNPLNPPAPPLYARALASSMGDDYPVLLPDLLNLELQFPRVDSPLPVLTMLKHRWMSGISATSNFSSSAFPGSGKQFTRIVSACLPEWCRSDAMLELGDATREGLVVDFI